MKTKARLKSTTRHNQGGLHDLAAMPGRLGACSDGRIVMWNLPAYLERYAARLATNGASPYLVLADSLAGIRAMLPPGMKQSERQPADPPEVDATAATGRPRLSAQDRDGLADGTGFRIGLCIRKILDFQRFDFDARS